MKMDRKQMLNRQPDTTVVALYSRCSTKGKGQDAENQARELKAFCQRMGYIIYKEYTDYESGATINRTEFQQMFEDARKRKFDVVLFWSLDRFSREGVLVTINLLQQLESYGVQYRSYVEPYLDSSGIFKDVIISLLATLAKQEKIRISERVRAGLERSRIKYGRVGGRPRIPQEKVAAINEMRSQGLSLRKIAKEIGVHHGTVREYLKN
jgi:DNA invertase Pin-like site-specific DNA recombinase